MLTPGLSVLAVQDLSPSREPIGQRSPYLRLLRPWCFPQKPSCQLPMESEEEATGREAVARVLPLPSSHNVPLSREAAFPGTV